MSSVNSERIPNNVHLGDDKRLQRALEAWQPSFLSWWNDMGPFGFQKDDVFLRTAISVTSEGWANFDYVKMPDYRWGIFLADPVQDRKIVGFLRQRADRNSRVGDDRIRTAPASHEIQRRRLQ